MDVRPYCRPRRDEEERGSLMALMSFQFVFYKYEDNVMVLLKLFYFKLTQYLHVPITAGLRLCFEN